MSKFKAGDLALIVNDAMYPQNIGSCVQLLRLVQPEERYLNPANVLVTNGCREAAWVVIGDGLVAMHGNGYCQKVEKNLMPLKGDFQPEQQKAKEEIA